MNTVEFLDKISKYDMTVPAAIGIAFAFLAVAYHSWILLAIHFLIDILIASVASSRLVSWLKEAI